jgi:Na+-translocating ferredoxin:NAD+ oxidoreductase RnfD subunit
MMNLASRKAGVKASVLSFSRTIFDKSFLSISSLSTAIGVMLMMVSFKLWIYFVVIGLGLLQKKYFRINNQHLFNPSNFALIMGLLLFYTDAHIILGQLGDELWMIGLLVVMGLAILIRVNRWVISMAFIFFYLLFQYLLVLSYDPVLLFEDIYYRFYSLSFLLFLLFMLTDPRTTPEHYLHQILFSLFVALLSTLFDRFYGFRVQHLFLSLFLFSLFVPFIGQKRILKALLIAFFATMVIITIESKIPYYFIMDRRG